MKICRGCKIEKEDSEFYVWRYSKDGRDPYCKSCKNKIVSKSNKYSVKHQKYLKEYYKMNKHKKNYRFYKLKMTQEEYDAMFLKQNGVCDICKGPELHYASLSVDHDHRCCPGNKTCGKCIRGLLCSHCNNALGLLRENILSLQSAIEYLQKHKT